jgi:hypothetical protein
MISTQNVTLSQLANEAQLVFKSGDVLKVELKEINRWNMTDYIRGGMQLVFIYLTLYLFYYIYPF